MALPRPKFVLDTSVVLKWFVEEDEADLPQARRLQDAYLQGRCTLLAPELLLFELANALKTGRRFTSSEVLKALEHVFNLELALEGLRWNTLAKAVEMASIHGATVYDSYFLVLAVESGSLLVTADDAFLGKVRAHPNVVSLRKLRLPN